eukprot:4474696-Prymnesium_polylepis.1
MRERAGSERTAGHARRHRGHGGGGGHAASCSCAARHQSVVECVVEEVECGAARSGPERDTQLRATTPPRRRARRRPLTRPCQ